ncbi:histone deacetylase family protein [Sanyastnella coralliicola]|uniref:histone deacetylase family protein n=1 Tax=Sanyastnella coralliicola TaxID=3069118 RepID=UPI0027BB11EE|nr:histone deacetylase [Longitalea sp. SCSIO 12813]
MLKIAWHPSYAHPLPDGHRFPMEKYELLPEQLIHEGTISESNLFAPSLLDEASILRVHDEEYWLKLKEQRLSRKEERRTGFPLSQQLVEREIRIMQGTVDCVDHAFEHGIAMNIAGGTHHAYTDHGEGFCLLNDLALAARNALLQGKAKRVLFVDLDVHQGNGSAEIFEKDESVFTFSMHGAKNYPMHKEKSDLDIPLPDGTDDNHYLSILKETLPRLFDMVEPDLICFQTGVDVLESDQLGRLGMTIDGCRERDRIVLERCHENDVPVICAMGGGYSKDIRLIVEAHANTFRLAQEIYF